ncbi:MAG: maleylacetoacetate isomerase [Polyangiales bacterium]
MELVLHHYWRSSASWRVRWALAIKRLSWTGRAVDIVQGEQHTADFEGKRSPIGHVPCLEVDGRPLTESVAILEWLDETMPEPPLYPRDPWQRARCRQLVELMNSGTQPLQNLSVLDAISKDAEARKVWAAKWIARGLAAFEQALEQVEREGGRGPHALGEAITAADIFLVPQLPNARRFEVDLAKLPRVCAVEAAALATHACTSTSPEQFAPKP